MDDKRMMANKTNEQAQLQAQLALELDKRRQKALLNLLENPDFKTLFAWLQERTGVNGEVFHGNSRDTFEKGKRAVGLMLLGEVLRLGEVGLKFRYAADLQYMHERSMMLTALQEKEDKKR
ncbi:MAG: hypothetical protein VB133_07535 [Anaeromusa sp.]|uniref:hypothetical protein n=1 Tax=Anaeromusa sp. TaxID=1872520 RepID=UPI002B1FFFE7|nr:hypothetical protein [Anaeromusa sp.]MEA4834968.1 hypothetical protein [Anaeromusa sp.]